MGSGRTALGVAALVGGYALLFLAAHPLLGAGATVLAIAPPAIAASRFGLRWGLGTTAATLIATLGLWRAFGDEPGTVIVRVGSGIGAVILVVVAAALGRLRDLERETERGIEQRDRLLDELRSSEERLQAVVGDLAVALLVVETDGRISHAKGAGLARLGLGAGELVGRSIFELLEADADRSTVRLVLGGGSGMAGVILGGRPLRFSFVPTKDPAGRATGGVGIALVE